MPGMDGARASACSRWWRNSGRWMGPGRPVKPDGWPGNEIGGPSIMDAWRQATRPKRPCCRGDGYASPTSAGTTSSIARSGRKCRLAGAGAAPGLRNLGRGETAGATRTRHRDAGASPVRNGPKTGSASHDRRHTVFALGNCHKVRPAAGATSAADGITLDRDQQRALGETRTPEYLAKNPNGPMIEHDDGCDARRIERDPVLAGGRHRVPARSGNKAR